MSYDILSILSSVIAILGYIPEIYYSLYNPELEIEKDLLDTNFQGILQLASPDSNQVICSLQSDAGDVSRRSPETRVVGFRLPHLVESRSIQTCTEDGIVRCIVGLMKSECDEGVRSIPIDIELGEIMEGDGDKESNPATCNFVSRTRLKDLITKNLSDTNSRKDPNIIYHNYYFTITYNHLKSTSWTLWSISSILSIIYSCLNYQYLFLVNYGIILLFNILVMISKNVKEIELTSEMRDNQVWET